MPLLSLQFAFPIEVDPNGSGLRFSLSTELGASKLVTGVRAVEQHFAKLLLTGLGSNIFDLDSGMALKEITRQPVDQDNVLSLKNDLALSIQSVTQQLIDSQEDLTLDDSEILVSSEILVMEYVDGVGWDISIRLNTQDGNATQVLLGG